MLYGAMKAEVKNFFGICTGWSIEWADILDCRGLVERLNSELNQIQRVIKNNKNKTQTELELTDKKNPLCEKCSRNAEKCEKKKNSKHNLRPSMELWS